MRLLSPTINFVRVGRVGDISLLHYILGRHFPFMLFPLGVFFLLSARENDSSQNELGWFFM